MGSGGSDYVFRSWQNVMKQRLDWVIMEIVSKLRQFRLYMLVGGMPQAVQTYIETNNFRKVDEIKRDILNLYESDFAKIDATGRLAMLLMQFRQTK